MLACRQCGAARFNQGGSCTGSAFYHFPLIATLQTQWSQWESWAKECYYPWEGHQSTPSVMTDIYDSPNWRQHVHLKTDDGNMGLILNADGMSMFKSAAYSIWPIFLMNANLPPELR